MFSNLGAKKMLTKFALVANTTSVLPSVLYDKLKKLLLHQQGSKNKSWVSSDGKTFPSWSKCSN